MCGLLCSAIYYSFFGFGVTTALPLIFVVIVFPVIFISHFVGNYKILVYTQLFCITWITALIQWSLGTIHDSGIVICWGFLGPIGALLLLKEKQAKIWMLMFLFIVGISVIVVPRFSLDGSKVTENARIIFYLMNLGMPSIVIFSATVYFVKNLTKQKKLIEFKNKEITDSINYAARIQKAILGDVDDITNKLSNAFIFFKPHSVVSGDFYWYAEIPEKGLKIIAAADCTGHGVPGAFMTVMGHDFLEEIIKTTDNYMPNKLLEKLDEKVTDRLKKQASKQQVNDGMDITILTIDENNSQIHFSGAKNPLYYVCNGVINIIKGSKSTIGGEQLGKTKEKIFELHTIETQKEDIFYIFSDGFQDQFGYETNKKYLTKNFRIFLHQISSLSLNEQKEKLEQELKKWKGNNHQTDDILVIGIRV